MLSSGRLLCSAGGGGACFGSAGGAFVGSAGGACFDSAGDDALLALVVVRPENQGRGGLEEDMLLISEILHESSAVVVAASNLESPRNQEQCGAGSKEQHCLSSLATQCRGVDGLSKSSSGQGFLVAAGFLWK